MSDEKFDVWREVCERKIFLRWIFTAAMVFLVLSAPFLLFAEFGSPVFVISTMNVVGFGLFAAVSGAAIRLCGKRY